MDALMVYVRRGMCGICFFALFVECVFSAGFRTRNFIVQTNDPQMARAIAEAAEQYRKALAIQWLGSPLPDWSQPCPIVARVSPRLGAGGVTSFIFDRGQPHDWRMTIEGPPDRILDSVLPHEITHTIFASHFGCPLPRWADEGACTTVENPSERTKHYQLLYDFLKTNRGIPFNQMVAMWEYPPDMLPLYAQGHAVVDFLLQQGGHRKFIQFLEEGMQSEDWNRTLQRLYRYQDLSDLQLRWVDWIRDGRLRIHPEIQSEATPPQLASATSDGSSWYAKQRQEGAALVSAGGPPSPRGFREIADTTRNAVAMQSDSRSHEGTWSSTRPGDVQGVPVQILEWDGPTGRPQPVPNSASLPPQYSRDSRQPATILR
jgi:hypothetical protein